MNCKQWTKIIFEKFFWKGEQKKYGGILGKRRLRLLFYFLGTHYVCWLKGKIA